MTDNFDIRLDRLLLSIEESKAEIDKRAAEAKAEADRRAAEADKRAADFDKRLDKISKQIEEFNNGTDRLLKSFDKHKVEFGNHVNNVGDVTEEEFYLSIKESNMTFFGIQFDSVEKCVKGIETGDEFDMVLKNCVYLLLIETKFKGHENDISKVLSKVERFRKNFSQYNHLKIILALASKFFYPDLVAKCKEKGIAMIRLKSPESIFDGENLTEF
jgi:CII-binding regulator of phage lambda lysogenization HflD